MPRIAAAAPVLAVLLSACAGAPKADTADTASGFVFADLTWMVSDSAAYADPPWVSAACYTSEDSASSGDCSSVLYLDSASGEVWVALLGPGDDPTDGVYEVRSESTLGSWSLTSTSPGSAVYDVDGDAWLVESSTVASGQDPDAQRFITLDGLTDRIGLYPNTPARAQWP